MIDFTIDTEIERKPGEVFAYVTDASKLANWQTNTVSAVPESDGPLRVGSRIKESTERLAERRSPSSWRSSSTNPTECWDCAISRPKVGARTTLEPTERGTRVCFRVYGQLPGVMRLAEPLLGLFVKRQFQRFCATLTSVLEDPKTQP